MDTITHTELEQGLKISFETNIPEMVYGGIGIGKSYTVREAAKAYAKRIGKEFRDYSAIDNKTRRGIADGTIKDISAMYIFFDIRASGMDPSDIKGLPGLLGTYVDWLPDIVFMICSRKDFFGCIFFDEMNQALPAVQSALYQVILDNSAGSLKLSDNCMRIAAGNRTKDKSNVNKISLALAARLTNEELQAPTADKWIQNFAYKNAIYDNIVSYLRFRPSDIYTPINDIKDSMNFANPRNWERLSSQMYMADKLYPKKDEVYFDLVDRLANRNIGGGAAITFSAYIRLHTKISITEILKDPSKIKNIEGIDRKLFALDMIAVEYGKKGIKLIETIGSLLQYIDADIGMSLIQNLRVKNAQFFSQFRNSKEGGKWAMDNMQLFSMQ